MLTVVLAVVLGAAGVEPAPDDRATLGVSVAWEAPDPCPDAAALLARVELITRRALRFDPDASATIEGRVYQGTSGDYHVDLTTRIGEQRETRALRATTCEAVVDASALVVALALEPHTSGSPLDASEGETAGSVSAAGGPASPSPSVPEPMQPATREPPAEPPTTSDAAPEPHARVPGSAPWSVPATATARARRPQSLISFAEGAGALAQTTTIAGGIAGGLGWQHGRARIDLGARHWFRATTATDPGVRLALTSGALRGCFVPTWGRVELPMCAGVEAGGMRARGRGTGVRSEAGTAPWFALLAGVDLVVVLTPWLGLRARVELAVALSRPTFHVFAPDVDRRVYVAAPVNARLGLGLQARFSLAR
jgi:hypothetical protein